MAVKIPQYVSLKRSSYHYQRAYPTKLRHLAPSRFYTAPLHLKVGATELELYRAADAINREFELYCRTLENADPSLYDDVQIDQLARKFIRERNLEVAELSSYRVDPFLRRAEKNGEYQRQADEADIAAILIPEFDQLSDVIREGRMPTLKERVVERAYNLLLQPKKTPELMTLSQLWPVYLQNKGTELSRRQLARVTTRWQRFLGFCGDGILNAESYVAIVDALDRYVDARRTDGVSEATIKRELAEVVACLNFGAKKLRLQWRVTRPDFKPHDPKQKQVMTVPEQASLLLFCLNPPDRQGKYAAIIVLGMLGGMMASEVSKLTSETVRLDGEHPYVVFNAKGKTHARKRVIPVTFGCDVLRRHLDEAIRWLNARSDSNAGACLNPVIQRATGNRELTMHCCRHTLRMNASRAGIDPIVMSEIGGWTNGARISRAMLQYGASALESTAHLAHLYEQSKRIYAEALSAISAS